MGYKSSEGARSGPVPKIPWGGGLLRRDGRPPSALIGKVQAFPEPTAPKQLQQFLAILGYWHSFIITHLAQLLSHYTDS